MSQQFPTSIGAQTIVIVGMFMSSLVPAVPDFDRCSDPHNYRDTVDHGTVPAVPDFDRCSDGSDDRPEHCPSRVPAVPDFDRCSDARVLVPRPSRAACPSSSRLRSVLRQGKRIPAWSVLIESQQFPTSIGAQTRIHAFVPPSRFASQQFPTSIGAQTRRKRGILLPHQCPSSSRLRSVLRLA